MRRLSTLLAVSLFSMSLSACAPSVKSVSVGDHHLTESDEIDERPPFTVSDWREISDQGRLAYIRVTIEGLKWSPRYASCSDLTADSLLAGVWRDVSNGADSGPLLVHVASAAQDLCPATF